MGQKKDKAKSIFGFIALGCALVVACVVAAPALAVVGVVVGTTTLISASTVVGATAVVATVGAAAAVTKAALHVSDGEYEEAVMSAAMAVPMMATAYAYGNAYVGMTSTSGRMVTGANASQAGSHSNPKPNQTAGNSSGQGGSSGSGQGGASGTGQGGASGTGQGGGWQAPPGYKLDANGKWHRPNGQFASNADLKLPPGAQTKGNIGWYNSDGTIKYPPYPGSVPGTERNVTLQPGQVVGRYGEIGPKTVFTTEPGAPTKSLSLPPNTSPSTYSEIKILKPVGAQQATIAEWPLGSGNGGGTQYVFKRPLETLRQEGYIDY